MLQHDTKVNTHGPVGVHTSFIPFVVKNMEAWFGLWSIMLTKPLLSLAFISSLDGEIVDSIELWMRQLTLFFPKNIFRRGLLQPLADYQYWISRNPKFATNEWLQTSSFHWYKNKYQSLMHDLTIMS